MTENESLSFGNYLKSVRLEKGIQLKTISRETRIGMDILQGIEREDHERLPSEAYVKGFVRAYARVVGTDAEEAVRRYLEGRQVYTESTMLKSDLAGSSRKSWPRALILMSLFAALAALLAGGWIFFCSGNTDDAATPGLTDAARSVQIPSISGNVADSGTLKIVDRQGMPSASTDAAEADGTDRSSAKEKMLLNIMTVDKTWLKVTIDDRNPQEFSLKTGDRLELEASVLYELTIENPAGVNLSLNGEPYPVSGNRDQPMTLSIP